MRAQAEELGQLVEHLVLDDRRFHVGDQQPLATMGDGLNDGVNRPIAQHGAGRRRGLGVRDRQVDGDALG